MKGKLFTPEKAFSIGLFLLGLAFKCFGDLLRAPAKSSEFYLSLTLFIFFLFFGTLSLGLYIGFAIAERNIARNMGKSKEKDVDQQSP
jgi:hypothetical protein